MTTDTYRLTLLKLFAAAILAGAILFSCSDSHELSERLSDAEAAMSEHPDSSLAMLRKIDVSKLDSDRNKARYALLMSQALDKNYIDTTTFEILQPAIDYFPENGSADEKLKTFYYQGRIYQNRHENDSAMQCFMRGREFCRMASDTLAAANLLVAQGTILYTVYKFDDFIEVNLEAAKLYKSIGKTDYELLSLANVVDGGILAVNKPFTDSIMDIAMQRVSENPDLGYIMAPHRLTYTLTFGDQDDISALLRYYPADSVDDMTKTDVAQAYCKIGDTYNAKRILSSIDSTSGVTASMKYKAVKSYILEQAGDLPDALVAYKKFYNDLESIHSNIFSHNLLFAKERYEMEKSNLIKIQKRDRIVWLSLCVAFALMIILGFIYYRYRLGKAKSKLDDREKEKLRLEKQTAELECERQSLAAENLRHKMEHLETEYLSLKDIMERREELAKPVEEAIRTRIEMLNGLLATQITGSESYAKPYDEWRDRILRDKDEFMNTTRLAFKASHPNFIKYLEDHGLSEAEINYVCLYAIGLRGKEVGEYIQLRRHYNISSEIRKKLGIDEHETNIGIYTRKLMKSL